MHFRHIFPGQDKAVPSFVEAVEECGNRLIFSRYNRQYNKHNTTLHARILLFLFFIPSFHLSFSPLYFLFFNPSSFLIILLLLLLLFFSSFFHIFSHIFIGKLKNAVRIFIQLIV